jgi:hypothetical protein
MGIVLISAPTLPVTTRSTEACTRNVGLAHAAYHGDVIFDSSTLISLRQAAQDEAITAYRQQRLAIRQFAEALDLDVWGAHDLLASVGVAVAQGGRSETAADLDAIIGSLH